MNKIASTLSIVLAAASLMAQTLPLSWQNHTAANDVQSLCSSGPHVWTATTGGLRSYNIETDEQFVWTNTDDLSSNRLNVVAPDLEQGVWIGHQNGRIQHYSPESDQWMTITDYEGHPISALFQRGDSLWVGLDIGVSLYLINRQEVKETYKRFGNLNQEIPVQAIQIEENKIWVATSMGIASADLDETNLLDPQTWQSYTTADGLSDNDNHSLVQTQWGLAAAAANGISVLQDNVWTVVRNASVYSLLDNGFDLVCAASDGVFQYNGSSWDRLAWGTLGIAYLTEMNSKLIGTSDQGFYIQADTGTDWNELAEIFLTGNELTSTLLADDGTLWVTTRDNGLAYYTDGIWTGINKSNDPELPINDWVSSAADDSGLLWFGSWGGGVISISPDSGMSVFNHTNSVFSGIPGSGNEDYVVVTTIFKDKAGNLWFGNYRALDGNGLIALDTEGEWHEYGWSDGLTSTYVKDLCEDIFGRLCIATEQGLFVLDHRGTLANRSDDGAMLHFTTSQGLDNNHIKALSTSADGSVYAASDNAINVLYDVSVSKLYGLPVQGVNDVLADGSGTVWAASREGLAHYEPSTFGWTVYQSDDGLAQNNVNSLSMDYSAGILYIATNGGLSIVSTPYSSPSESMDDLTIFPNPFNVHEADAAIIEGLGNDVSVSVFTSSGYEVRHYDSDLIFGSKLAWDGRDHNGSMMPSGVYVVVGVNQEGKSQKGKLVLIR